MLDDKKSYSYRNLINWFVTLLLFWNKYLLCRASSDARWLDARQHLGTLWIISHFSHIKTTISSYEFSMIQRTTLQSSEMHIFRLNVLRKWIHSNVHDLVFSNLKCFVFVPIFNQVEGTLNKFEYCIRAETQIEDGKFENF